VLRLLGIVICALALTACGDDDESGSEGSGGGGGGADTTAAEPQAEQPAAKGGCKEVEQPDPKPDGGAKRPSGRLDPDATYVVTLATSCGDIAIRLDQKTSPRTAASFANLARTGFYDDTVFHRIVPGFVIQGGDPTASGTGGPGYSTRDVPPPNTTYTKGVVAMAKSQVEPAGTAGSQFYIVTAPDAGLPPDYALLGEVVEGRDVVDRIGELGDPASGGAGTPLEPVVIESAELSKR
jgi:peptidyl-prolyl cis-trans isomerase B (cyclophilin B)